MDPLIVSWDETLTFREKQNYDQDYRKSFCYVCYQWSFGTVVHGPLWKHWLVKTKSWLVQRHYIQWSLLTALRSARTKRHLRDVMVTSMGWFTKANWRFGKVVVAVVWSWGMMMSESWVNVKAGWWGWSGGQWWRSSWHWWNSELQNPKRWNFLIYVLNKPAHVPYRKKPLFYHIY